MEAGVLKANVSPLSEECVPLPKLAFKESGEYTLRISSCLSHDTIWAEKGFEITFGEITWKEEEREYKEEKDTLTVVHGDVNIGVRGKNFSAMFSQTEGGIASLCYNGKEFITRRPELTFWRALTDNDRGCSLGYDCGCWSNAGAYRKIKNVSVEESENSVTITFEFAIPVSKEIKTSVSYTAKADGTIKVHVSYEGVKGLPDLPAFGLEWRFKEKYHNVRYYGMGPEENYIDRCEGARLGIFNTTAKKNVSAYLVPQECGNRTGVRWLELSDEEGTGLRFEAAGQPFEAGVLPWSTRELDAASHKEELSVPHYTWVRILAKQMGVGGDDSWGAPVHEQYRISSDEKLDVEFFIKPL